MTKSELALGFVGKAISGAFAATVASLVFCSVTPFLGMLVFALQPHAVDPVSVHRVGSVISAVGLYLIISIGLSVLFAGPCFMISLVLCIFIGIPAHLILSSLRVQSLASYAITGVIVSGVLTTWWLTVGHIGNSALPKGPLVLPDVIACGPVAAVPFWWVAVRPYRLQATRIQ
jgi:hypothetical protein